MLQLITYEVISNSGSSGDLQSYSPTAFLPNICFSVQLCSIWQRFQLTHCVAQSLCCSWAFCVISGTVECTYCPLACCVAVNASVSIRDVAEVIQNVKLCSGIFWYCPLLVWIGINIFRPFMPCCLEEVFAPLPREQCTANYNFQNDSTSNIVCVCTYSYCHFGS